jgi:nitrite reductase/ring-hydroxylating ferredoxin subunit
MRAADASIDRMLDRLLRLFRGKPAIVHGTSRLPEGQAKKVEIGDVLAGGKTVILCRVDGRLHALDARCPHEGGRILDGPLIDGRYAICPLHNYTFDPQNGRVVRGSCPNATVYPVRETGGDAELWA